MRSLQTKTSHEFPGHKRTFARIEYDAGRPIAPSTTPSDHMSVIEAHNLIKRYGDIEALKGVSLDVERGEIYGLLGQNGAGKTTLIKVLLGITAGTAGEAKLLGEPAGTVV